jgi:hypothetical protein
LQAVLLGRHGHAVDQRGHLADDVGDRPASVARLALADEPGVLGKAAAVEEQRLAVAVADRADGPEVLQRDGLAAAGVVGHGDHDHGHVVAALVEQGVEGLDVHVALERVLAARDPALGDRQVDGLGAAGLDVRPRGVEVGVVRDRRARAPEHAEEDLLRRAALVRGDHVDEPEQVLHGIAEAKPRRRARVALVAALDAGPLLGAHRAGARVGEQVDQHVLGRELEDVVLRRRQRRDPLLARRELPGFDRLDAERLDDGVKRVHG